MIEEIALGDCVISFKNNVVQRDCINSVLNDDLTLKPNGIKQFILFGGFRCGKSFLFQFITFILCLVYPGLRVVYVRRTYDQLKDSVIKQFRDDFEKFGQFKYIESSASGSRIAKFHNGSEIRFRAFDKDTNILSAEYDLACVCQLEEIQEELYKQLFGRLSGKVMPKAFLMGEGNPRGNWVKSTFYDLTPQEREDKAIYFDNAPTSANSANLPSDYLDTLKTQYSEEDFKRWAEGSWQNLYGSVFSSFSEDKNVIDPIDRKDIAPNEVILIGGDYGYRNPAAFVWMFKDYDGNYIIFDEFYKSGCSPEVLADANKRHGSFLTLMDYSIKRPDRDGKNLWDDFIKLGLKLKESNKDELRNIISANSLFHQGKLFICSNCTNLISEIKKYKYPEQKLGAEKNFNESPVDKDNHGIDATLYVLAEMENRHSTSPNAIANQRSLMAMTQRRTPGGVANYG